MAFVNRYAGRSHALAVGICDGYEADGVSEEFLDFLILLDKVRGETKPTGSRILSLFKQAAACNSQWAAQTAMWWDPSHRKVRNQAAKVLYHEGCLFAAIYLYKSDHWVKELNQQRLEELMGNKRKQIISAEVVTAEDFEKVANM